MDRCTPPCSNVALVLLRVTPLIGQVADFVKLCYPADTVFVTVNVDV